MAAGKGHRQLGRVGMCHHVAKRHELGEEENMEQVWIAQHIEGGSVTLW